MSELRQYEKSLKREAAAEARHNRGVAVAIVLVLISLALDGAFFWFSADAPVGASSGRGIGFIIAVQLALVVGAYRRISRSR